VVVENGELATAYHPDGAIRPTPEEAESTTDFAFDHFVKYYSGNVRAVVTEENATFTKRFLATWEEPGILAEQQNFDNLPENQIPVPTGYPHYGLCGAQRVRSPRSRQQ
jgi:hypothetical protein